MGYPIDLRQGLTILTMYLCTHICTRVSVYVPKMCKYPRMKYVFLCISGNRRAFKVYLTMY